MLDAEGDSVMGDAAATALCSPAYVDTLDWLVTTSSQLRTMASTPFIAVHLMDAYVRVHGDDAVRMATGRLRAAAACALVLASKFEDVDQLDTFVFRECSFPSTTSTTSIVQSTASTASTASTSIAGVVRVKKQEPPNHGWVLESWSQSDVCNTNVQLLQAAAYTLAIPTIGHFIEHFFAGLLVHAAAAVLRTALSLGRLTLRDPKSRLYPRSKIAFGCLVLAMEGRVDAMGCVPVKPRVIMPTKRKHDGSCSGVSSLLAISTLYTMDDTSAAFDSVQRCAADPLALAMRTASASCHVSYQ